MHYSGISCPLTCYYPQVRDVDHSADAMRDRYFDDCSWMSLLLLEGIELPLRSMHPEAEESFPIEAQNVIDRLNYLVNETKLNGNTVSLFWLYHLGTFQASRLSG